MREGIMSRKRDVLEIGSVVVRADVRTDRRRNFPIQHILPVTRIGTSREPFVLLYVLGARLQIFANACERSESHQGHSAGEICMNRTLRLPSLLVRSAVRSFLMRSLL
jgi:hypothetical protein